MKMYILIIFKNIEIQEENWYIINITDTADKNQLYSTFNNTLYYSLFKFINNLIEENNDDLIIEKEQ